MLQFYIRFIIMPFNNWHSIIRLKSKAMWEVIHKNRATKIRVSDDPQIFYKKSILRFHAVASVQHTTDEGFVRIYEIYDRFCVIWAACSENKNIPELTKSLQKFYAKWTDLQANLTSLIQKKNKDLLRNTWTLLISFFS